MFVSSHSPRIFRLVFLGTFSTLLLVFPSSASIFCLLLFSGFFLVGLASFVSPESFILVSQVTWGCHHQARQLSPSPDWRTVWSRLARLRLAVRLICVKGRVVSGLTGCAAYLDDLLVCSAWAYTTRLGPAWSPNLTVKLGKWVCQGQPWHTWVRRLGRVWCGLYRPKWKPLRRFLLPPQRSLMMGYYRGFCKNSDCSCPANWPDEQYRRWCRYCSTMSGIERPDTNLTPIS